jgi:hypothetical protein
MKRRRTARKPTDCGPARLVGGVMRKARTASGKIGIDAVETVLFSKWCGASTLGWAQSGGALTFEWVEESASCYGVNLAVAGLGVGGWLGGRGLRFLAISSTSAANSGSRTGPDPVSSCFFAWAMESEMDRRVGSAVRRIAAGLCIDLDQRRQSGGSGRGRRRRRGGLAARRPQAQAG